MSRNYAQRNQHYRKSDIEFVGISFPEDIAFDVAQREKHKARNREKGKSDPTPEQCRKMAREFYLRELGPMRE